ncbi:Tim44 domain-containing protein [Trinickia dinghuensis]|uniref:Tim44 domain-containing protein n=1 Tax=Trinickia dinghuensis TaxID=2291023 RepID=A0A3D8K3F4_9BURK|nr:Tim44-like domain-containing protein [Trinickia dinghuensis]RDU99838.1 Tim44 domain-containing protein [Trinickia dinghuensis]
MADSLSISSKLLSLQFTKRIRLFTVATMIAAGTLITLDAEAKRMGGGRSIGRQSQTMQRESAPPQQLGQSSRSAQAGTQPAAGAQAQRAQGAQAAAAATPSRSRWLGPIAGLAAGLGIAALLSHFGLGGAFAGAMANVIVVALLAMIGIWLVRKLMSMRRKSGTPALAAAGGALPMGRDAFGGGYESAAQGNGGAAASAGIAHAAFERPADFDEPAFLHHAKVNFVRLQAAWDAGNLTDIRAFSTPEMFAELKLELDARAGTRNETDVVQLNAELVELEEDAFEYRASVRYTGLIREAAGEAAQPLDETWQLNKPKRGGDGWLLAGIQQSTVH